MTEFKKLAHNITVSTQMTKEEFATAAEMGIKTIICNRIEGEETGQPSNQEMLENATKHGIEFIALPMGGEFPMAQATEMANLLHENPSPIHAYCKSGTRSAILWGLATAINHSKTPSEIMAATQSAGFDLINVEPAFHQLYDAAQQD